MEQSEVCEDDGRIKEEISRKFQLNGGSSKIAEPYNKRDVGCSIYDAP